MSHHWVRVARYRWVHVESRHGILFCRARLTRTQADRLRDWWLTR